MPVNENIEDLKESFKRTVVSIFELKKLEAIEAFSVVGASLISKLLVGLVVLLFVCFLSFAIGFYLSFLLGDYYMGFSIVAGFYFILSIILLMVRKKLIERWLLDSIIRKIFKS